MCSLSTFPETPLMPQLGTTCFANFDMGPTWAQWAPGGHYADQPIAAIPLFAGWAEEYSPHWAPSVCATAPKSRAACHSYFIISARAECRSVLNYIVIICNYSVTELGIKYCVHLTSSSLIFLSLCFALILISPNHKFVHIRCRFTRAPVKVALCLRQICLACELTLFSFVLFGQFRFIRDSDCLLFLLS